MRPRTKLFSLWFITIFLGTSLALLNLLPSPTPGIVQPTIHTNTNSLIYIIILCVSSFVSTYIIIRLGDKALRWYILGIVYLSMFFSFFSTLNLLNEILGVFTTLDEVALSIFLAGVVWYLGKKWPNFLTTMLGAILISLLGVTLPVLWLFIFLVIMSVYDFIAVFKLKSMQKMASRIVQVTTSPFAFIAGDASQISERLAGKDAKVGLLGLGDAVIPGGFIAGVALSSSNPGITLLTFCGAYFGLLGNLFIANKVKTMLPALPLICVGSAVGYLLGVAISLV